VELNKGFRKQENSGCGHLVVSSTHPLPLLAQSSTNAAFVAKNTMRERKAHKPHTISVTFPQPVKLLKYFFAADILSVRFFVFDCTCSLSKGSEIQLKTEVYN
jgi:hypothetical protein